MSSPVPVLERVAFLDAPEPDGVATVVLPRRVTLGLIRELDRVCDHLEDGSRAALVAFRGRDGVFNEGIDFTEFRSEGLDIHGFNRWEKALRRVERLPMATLAALDGPALGGGLQLALTCDLRVATPSATLQLPEVHQGFLPGMATFRLARFVGLGVARRLVLTAEVLGGAEALEVGLVDRVVGSVEEGVAWARAALGPAHRVPVTLARRLLAESAHTSFEDALGHFLAAQHRAISQDAFLRTLKTSRDPS